MTFLSIDFETASRCDLKRAGAVKYSLDPTTRVLCMAYRFGQGPVEVWREGDPFPDAVRGHVDGDRTVTAWNAAFEHAIWNSTLLGQAGTPGARLPTLKLEQLDDTMARAAYWGLPLSLDMAGPAIGLPFRKDAAGHKLMMQMCKPRRFLPDGTCVWWHETDPAKFDRLVEYCRQDVLVESEIAKRLPPLPDRERALWVLDKKINLRGVGVDLDLADKLQAVTDQAMTRLNVRLAALTGGAVEKVTRTTAMLAFLQGLGSPVLALDKETVAERLKDPACVGLEREVLEVRRESAKASTAKIRAAKGGELNGRLYGLLQHYGALRTGRWAGRIFQPQNLPRPLIKLVEEAQACILAGADADALELLFPASVLDVVSACLRGMLVAAPDHVFVVADFAQIEARVNPWLAGQRDILEVFARGDDVYVYTAHKIGSQDRQLGKTMVLGLGFGMGPPKFQATAKLNKVRLSLTESEDNVRAWRDANPAIVQFWWDMDAAARRVANGELRPIQVGAQDLTLYRRGGSMIIRLPSGRELVYRNVGIDYDPVTGRDGVTYEGLNQYTRRWERVRTYGGKLVENVVQATARDVMADAMLELDRRRFRTVLTVHDELLAEQPAPTADLCLQNMLDVMRKAPPWAAGLPVWAEGWTGPRYKKG